MDGNQPGALSLTKRPQNITRRLWANQIQVPWGLLPRPWPTACFHPSASPFILGVRSHPSHESTVMNQDFSLLQEGTRSQVQSLEHQFEGSAHIPRKDPAPCTQLRSPGYLQSQQGRTAMPTCRGARQVSTALEKTPLVSCSAAGGAVRSSQRIQETGCWVKCR